jgi:hypothetical protein
MTVNLNQELSYLSGSGKICISFLPQAVGIAVMKIYPFRIFGGMIADNH